MYLELLSKKGIKCENQSFSCLKIISKKVKPAYFLLINDGWGTESSGRV